MSRVKTFDATGIAPGGRLYAGDMNAIQDHYADLSNYAQTVGLGVLAVGDATIQLLKFGTGEARLSGALRTDGILRAGAGGAGVGGIVPAIYTTAQRDAIPLGSRPSAMMVYNSTTGRFEWNSGTDATPSWRPVGVDSSGASSIAGNLTLTGTFFSGGNVVANNGIGTQVTIGNISGSAGISFGTGPLVSLYAPSSGMLRTAGSFQVDGHIGAINVYVGGWGSDAYIYRRAGNTVGVIGSFAAEGAVGSWGFLAYGSGESQPRAVLRNDASLSFGPGGSAGLDTSLVRSGVGILTANGELQAGLGIFPGSLTTTQRNALADRPTGLVIYNNSNARLEVNAGSQGAPNWQPLGYLPSNGSSITNADIAAGAAIVPSKLAGYPSDGGMVLYGDGTWRRIDLQTTLVGTSYTLAANDASRLVEVNAGSAATVTVPADGTVNFPIGTTISVAQLGGGSTNVAAAGGVTLRSYNNNLRLAGQGAVCSIIKRAANDWYVAGNLVP